MSNLRIAALGAALISLAGAAQAGELLVGIYAHDATFLGDTFGVGSAGRESGADLHLGYRTERIEALGLIFKPQAHAFISVNSESTSNFVAAGLSWPIDLTHGFYLRPGLGLAYTDGEHGLPPVNAPGLSAAEVQRRLNLYNTRIDFGSALLFEPEISVGYRFSERLSGELSWVHISNGEVFHQGKNQGMDDAGVRFAYKF
jgi:lipid A 3-O-deacylase